jgi:tetratricopeptide (TPR) repeat protein
MSFAVALLLLVLQADVRDPERRARDLMAAGKTGEAIPLFEKIVRAAPDDAGARLNLAIAYFKAARHPEAIEQSQAALRLRPGLAAAQLFLGASYFELRDYARAIEPLSAAVKALPSDRNARVMLAESLLEQERLTDAVSHFRAVAPTTPRVLYGLGAALDRLARDATLAVQRNAADSAYAAVLVGDEYLRQRRYGLALQHYRQAAARNPWLRGLRSGLSALYRQTGHSEWAVEEPAPDCRTKTLECDFAAGRYWELVDRIRSPEGVYWAARAYRELSRQSYEELSKHPASLEYRLRAAETLDAAGLHAEAIREWRAAQKIAPDDERVQNGLAWSLFRSRDYEPVLALAEKLPDSAEALFLRGASLLNLEQPEKAISPLEAALAADPQFLPARAALGHALLRTGRAADAIPHLSAALPVDEDGSVRYQLQRAYDRAGKPDQAAQARQEYRRFMNGLEHKRKEEEGHHIARVPLPPP